MCQVEGGGITCLAQMKIGGDEVAAPRECESATREQTSATETDSETDSPSSSAAETTEPPEFEVLSPIDRPQGDADDIRSEEHTSELQSRGHLVCRLLLEKKKKNQSEYTHHVQKSTLSCD